MNQRPLQELRLRNFRCFREQQIGRVAPLTLLVGENSTGKTSFLAAVRAILEVANYNADPDFRAFPYDLGSFAEIAHRQRPSGGRGGAESFTLGFRSAGGEVEAFTMDATFMLGDGAAPTLSAVLWSTENVWIRELRCKAGSHTDIGCPSGSWRLPPPTVDTRARYIYGGDVASLAHVLKAATDSGEPGDMQPMRETHAVPSESDASELIGLFVDSARFRSGAFPGAPIRSSPLRTYDPVRLVQDPQGFSMPSFLADVYSRDPERWRQLKESMDEFGRTSGLFDEIFVKRLGRNEFEPFQLEVRKWGKRRKGAKRNLIDVGYGVSQVLPLLVELVNPAGYSLFLLQQPEVHLHPSAQAALGSLFCTIAASGRQLVVETHSEYIIDRVRMDIRDRRSELKPHDVSVLFFERTDLDVHVHSLRFDEQGNVLDAPDGYGRFFMDETRRSIGL